MSLLAAALLALQGARSAAELALAPPARAQEQEEEHEHGDAHTTFEQDYASLVPS